jgi:hypothetical protein
LGSIGSYFGSSEPLGAESALFFKNALRFFPCRWTERFDLHWSDLPLSWLEELRRF